MSRGDTGHPTVPIMGFDAGYISKYPADALPPNALTRAANFFVEDGQAVKRRGSVRVNSVDLTTATGVHAAYYSDGTIADKLVVASGTILIDLTTGTEASIGTGFTSNQNWGFAEAISAGTAYIFMYAEGNAPRKWTGSGATTAATGPAVNCRYAVWHKDRMWALRSDDRRLFMSTRNVPETWPTANFIPITKPSDGLNTGLVSMDEYLVMFTEGRIYLIYGQNPTPPGTNLSVRAVPTQGGCVAPLSVVKDQKTGAIYYVGWDGIYALEGTTVKSLSRNIQADFDTINKAALDKCASVMYKDTLWVAVPYGAAQTTNNRVYVFHVRKPGVPVTYFTGVAPNCFAKSFLNEEIYWGHPTSAKVLQYDETTYVDESTAVDFDMATAGIGFKQGPLMTYRGMRAQFQAGTVTSGTVNIYSGPDLQSIDSFAEAPSSPFSLAATGSIMGDAGGPTDVALNGIVNQQVVLPTVANGPLTGNFWRLRLRANTSYACTIRRLAIYAQEDTPPLEEAFV